jgi:hypothetical protein
MAHITWTKAEKALVAERSFEIRMSVTTETDIDCVRRAMSEMLATEKQRNLRGMSDVLWVQDQWRILTKNAQSKTANGRVWSSTPTPAPRPQSIQPVVNPRIELESTPIPALKDVPTMEIFEELGRRISSMMNGDHIKQMIRQEVNAVLERRLPGVLAPDEPQEIPQQEERAIKLKICVIGLLDGQQELIKREYSEKVSFLFMERTPSLQKIKHAAQQYDHVIQMLKFSNQIKGANQIEKFHMLGGLLTQLRDFINRQVATL